MILGIEFPPVSHLVEWGDIWGSGAFAINKVVLINFTCVILTLAFFFVAGRQRKLVPSGVQSVAESSITFIEDQIVLQTMGPDGMRFAPFLLAIFFYVLLNNIFEVIPLVQMPGNARIATPAFLAVLVWLIYNFMGIARNGPWGYLKSIIFPPGVPIALLPLVALIEFVSKVLVQPFALMVRLFANLLAGHLLLVAFIVLSQALFDATVVGAALPFVLLVALTGFEVLVSLLQAYIFAILTGVFIGAAMNPEH